MEERRKYIRIPEHSQIIYKVIPEEKAREHQIRDISQGGIKFLVNKFIPKGSHLRIKITFPKTFFTIEALVELMWVREVPSIEQYEVGVQFIDIPPKAIEHLVKYIQVFLTLR